MCNIAMINVQFQYKIMLVSPIPTIYGPRPCATTQCPAANNLLNTVTIHWI